MSTKSKFFKQRNGEKAEQQRRDAGFSQASQGGLDQAEVNKNRAFFESYSDPDISAGPKASAFEARVAPELSHHHLFGNIDRAEFERLQPLNQALAMQVKAEFPRRTGVSSKCTGQYRRRLVGDSNPVLNDEMARKVDSTLGEEGVRKQMQSQSIQASAWKGITTMKSVVKTMGENAKSAGSGALGRAKKFLFGGSD